MAPLQGRTNGRALGLGDRCALCEVGGSRDTAYCTGRPSSTPAHRRCLHSLVVDPVDTGAARLVLERHDTQQRADHQLIQHTVAGLGGHITHVHLRGHEEPLLWAADAVTWAYSADGDWRRRVDPMLDKAVLLDLLP